MIIKKLSLLLLLLTNAAILPAQSNPTDTISSKNKIMMVGNSITNHGDWKAVLLRSDVTNWGIPGYTTEQISWTIKHLIILKPKVCFLEGGINDLTLGITPKRIYQNQVKVIDTLLAHNIIPVVQSTIYQNPSADRNEKVKKVNKMIWRYCAEHQVDYLDLNGVLSENGLLKASLTTDGTHLKPEAYVIWAKLIQAELKKLNL